MRRFAVCQNEVRVQSRRGREVLWHMYDRAVIRAVPAQCEQRRLRNPCLNRCRYPLRCTEIPETRVESDPIGLREDFAAFEILRNRSAPFPSDWRSVPRLREADVMREP